MPNLLQSRPVTPAPAKPRVQVFQAATLTECLLQARRQLGPDAEIISQRKIKKGSVLGRWGGTECMEVTCRLSHDTSLVGSRSHTVSGTDATAQIQTLETRLSELTASMQALVESSKTKPFQPFAVAATPATPVPAPEPAARRSLRNNRAPALTAPAEPYLPLLRSLLDADVAQPLARQWVAELPKGLSESDARTEMRTRLAQRLLISARPSTLPRGQMRILAFIGTTGVGKTTTIAKLAARFSLMERRRVGIITLDTFRVAAAQQLKTYGDVLRLPVQVAHNPIELAQQINDFKASGIEIVLLDTTGRSPNEMLPLGEAASVFESLENVEKYLTVPATLSARDIDHIVARFRHAFTPDALILTKLDEAIDSACFGKVLTVQAKYGIALAYITTGQRVPDDIAIPDAHAIAARIVSNTML